MQWFSLLSASYSIGQFMAYLLLGAVSHPQKQEDALILSLLIYLQGGNWHLVEGELLIPGVTWSPILIADKRVEGGPWKVKLTVEHVGFF